MTTFANVRQGVRASANFKPASVPDLILDLDGAKGVTNLGTVRNWRDKSAGIEHDAVQLTTTKQPAFTEIDANFNGHGSLNADGVDDWISVANHADLSLDGGLTVYIVGAMPAPGAFGRILSKITGGNEYTLLVNVAQTVTMNVRNAANTAWFASTPATKFADGGSHVIRVMYDLSTVKTRVDTDEASSAATSHNTGTSDVALFATTSATDAVDLDTPRILIYNNAVSTADDTLIMAELNALYLGSGTPTGFDFSGVRGLVLDLNGDEGVELEGVSAWADQSGSANVHDAGQATAAARPVYLVKDHLFNGHGSLSFDGVASFVTIVNHLDFELDSGLTHYVVASIPKPSAAAYLMNKRRTNALSASWMMQFNASGKMNALARNAANSAWYTASGSGVGADGTVRVFRFRSDVTVEVGTRFDNTAEITKASPDFVVSSTGGVVLARIASATTGGYMLCVIARILTYKRAVTAAEDVRIMRYLQDEYTARAFDSGFSNGFQSR